MMPLMAVRHQPLRAIMRFGTTAETGGLDLNGILSQVMSISGGADEADTLAPTLDGILEQARRLGDTQEALFPSLMRHFRGGEEPESPLKKKYRVFDMLLGASERYATDAPSQLKIATFAMSCAADYDSGREFQHRDTLEPMFLVAANIALNRALAQDPTNAEVLADRLQVQLSLRAFPTWASAYGGGASMTNLEMAYAPLDAVEPASVNTMTQLTQLVTVHERMGDAYLKLPHHRQQTQQLYSGPLTVDTSDQPAFQKALGAYDKTDALFTRYLNGQLHQALACFGCTDGLFDGFYSLVTVRPSMPNSSFYTKYAQLCDQASQVFTGEAAAWQTKARNAVLKEAIITANNFYSRQLVAQLQRYFPPQTGEDTPVDVAAIRALLPQVVTLHPTDHATVDDHTRRLTG